MAPNWYPGIVVIVVDHKIRFVVSKDWWCNVSTVVVVEEEVKEANRYKG